HEAVASGAVSNAGRLIHERTGRFSSSRVPDLAEPDVSFERIAFENHAEERLRVGAERELINSLPIRGPGSSKPPCGQLAQVNAIFPILGPADGRHSTVGRNGGAAPASHGFSTQLAGDGIESEQPPVH